MKQLNTALAHPEKKHTVFTSSTFEQSFVAWMTAWSDGSNHLSQRNITTKLIESSGIYPYLSNIAQPQMQTESGPAASWNFHRPKIFLKALPDKVQCHKVCLTVDLDHNTQLRVEMHLANWTGMDWLHGVPRVCIYRRISLKVHTDCKMCVTVCKRDGIKSLKFSDGGFMGLFWTFLVASIANKACQSHVWSDDTFHWQVACLLVLGVEGYNISAQHQNSSCDSYDSWHVLVSNSLRCSLSPPERRSIHWNGIHGKLQGLKPSVFNDFWAQLVDHCRLCIQLPFLDALSEFSTVVEKQFQHVPTSWVFLSALVKRRPQKPTGSCIPIHHARLLLLPCPSSSTIP